MHCLQSIHSPDSTLLRFLPLLFLLVWHPILYLITFSLDFPVLLLNPETILTPFTPLIACTQFTSHIPLTSLHSRSFRSSLGILYSPTPVPFPPPLAFYIHFNPFIPSAHSSSTTLSTPSTSYASITPSVACILFITSLLGLPFFQLLSPLLGFPSHLLIPLFL